MKLALTRPKTFLASAVIILAVFAMYLYGTAAAAGGPVTTAISTPAAPDGLRGWFQTNPTITLTSKPALTTYYSWDDKTAMVLYKTPFKVPTEGVHTLYYYSVDTGGSTESVNARVFKVDTGRPVGTVYAPKRAKHIRRNLRITVKASDIGGSASGLDYITVYIGSKRLGIRTSSPARFIIDTRKIKRGRRKFKVLVKDKAGNVFRWRRRYRVDNASPGISKVFLSPSLPAAGRHAEVFFKVRDRVARKVRVVVQIRKTNGRLFSEASLGWLKRRAMRSVDLKMPRREGTYVAKIIARDRAGNRRIRRLRFPVGNYWMIDNVKSHIRELSKNIGVRVEGTHEEHRAADYIEEQLRGYGYAVGRQAFSLPDGKTSYNIIARKKGVDPNRRFIVGAHYDSKAPAPGANDNGTGVGTVLELARLFKTKRTNIDIVFVLFGAEERFGVGRYPEHIGSRHYVSTMSGADRAATVGMISVDMVGVGSTFHVRSTRKGTMSLVNDILNYGRTHGTAISYAQDYGWSDHDQFESAGIPSAWLEWRSDSLFHTTQDVYERIQWDAVDITGKFLSDYLITRFAK